MRIHKEGWVSIVIVFVFTTIVWSLSLTYLSHIAFLKYALCMLSLGLLAIVVYFFRMNERKKIIDENAIFSSADGKVVVIEPVEEFEYFGGQKMLQISVFMSPLNMHANWWPVNGKVVYAKHHNGKFRVAWHPKSSTENERSAIVVKSKQGKEILIKQVAGAMARRIVTYTKVGDDAVQGNELGFIKFGSRVDFILPLDVNVKAKIGDVVTGSQTIIATWN